MTTGRSLRISIQGCHRGVASLGAGVGDLYPPVPGSRTRGVPAVTRRRFPAPGCVRWAVLRGLESASDANPSLEPA